ncbi:MAG: CFI-box-CTERM domain-containing protein [Dehalococcoidales bacterium]
MFFGKKKRGSDSLEENLAQWREIREGKSKVDEQDEAQEEDSQCFIVTAVYGSPLAREVDTMKLFRDDFLLSFNLGRLFVKTYYTIGPSLARYISGRVYLRSFLRKFILSLVVKAVKITHNLWSSQYVKY